MVGRHREILEQSRSLLTYARPVMENLFAQIANTDSVVLLSDANGMVVHSLGDPSFVGKADRVRLMPGYSWEERHRGTNAIGTALVEERPLVVHGAEHYLERNLFLTCSASPVFDPKGQVVGVLDISGQSDSYQRHTLALVQMSAQMIENRMLASEFESQLIVSFHARPEFLGTLCEGIAVFSLDGKLLAANRSALFQLELKRTDVPRQRFSQIFDMHIDEALNYVRFGGREAFSMLLKGGIRLFAHLRCGAISSKPLFFGGGIKTPDALHNPAGSAQPAAAPVEKSARTGAPMTLDELIGEAVDELAWSAGFVGLIQSTNGTGHACDRTAAAEAVAFCENDRAALTRGRDGGCRRGCGRRAHGFAPPPPAFPAAASQAVSPAAS